MRDIILKPAIIEKSTNLMDNKKYAFDVPLTATKTQVYNAVEEILDVKVKSINIMSARGKDRRAGHYTGKAARRRKAIVILTDNSNDIRIFTEEDNR